MPKRSERIDVEREELAARPTRAELCNVIEFMIAQLAGVERALESGSPFAAGVAFQSLRTQLLAKLAAQRDRLT